MSPQILINSRTLRYGIGCFETIKVFPPNKAAFLTEHIERLVYGAQICRIDPPRPLSKWEQNCDLNSEAQFISGLMGSFSSSVLDFLSDKHYETPQIMRLIYTKETGLEISIEPYKEKNNSLRLRVCNKWLIESTSPLNSFKSFNYLSKYLSCKESKTMGFDDSLLINEKGHLVETSKANLFFMKHDGSWITPSIYSGCLHGVIRNVLIPYLSAQEVEIRPESLSEFKSAIATNSLIEVQAVSQINDFHLNNLHFEILEFEEINKLKKYLSSVALGF